MGIEAHRHAARTAGFRAGLVFKAHRLLYHSTLGLRVIKNKNKKQQRRTDTRRERQGGPRLSLSLAKGTA